MTRVDPPRGASPTQKRVATVVALVGVAVVGAKLSRTWPRDVPVVYQVDETVNKLDVDIVVEGEAVASARFQRPPRVSTPFRHTLTLQPGEYQALLTTYDGNGRGTEYERILIVPAEGLTRFDLRE